MPSREPELYKDKIEVSLDGRQIFYLFFGGAVIVGLVFVLGVMTGRRVEARGHLDRAQTQTARDPLAALDHLERSDHLSFRRALTGSAAPTDVEKAIGEIEKRRGDGKPEKVEARSEKAEPRSEKVEPRSEKVEARSEKPEARSEDKRHDGDKKKKHDDRASSETRPDAKPDRSDARRSEKADKPVTRPDARVDARADVRADAKVDTRGDARSDARADAKVEARTDAKLEARSEPRPEPRSDAETRPVPESKVRFTLQLSSFQDRSEAEAFLGAMKSAGFQPYLIEAEVSGKGTFYRVRLGSYRSLEAANDARAAYEKTAKKTAQVMRL